MIATRCTYVGYGAWGGPEQVSREALRLEHEQQLTDDDPREWERRTGISEVVEDALENVRRRRAA